MIIKRALKRVRSRESRRICIPERWRVNKVAKQIASSDTKQEHMKFWTLQIRAQEETTMANARLLMLLSFYIVSQIKPAFASNQQRERRSSGDFCQLNRWGELCPNDCVLHANSETTFEEVQQNVTCLQQNVQQTYAACQKSIVRMRAKQDEISADRVKVDGKVLSLQNATLHTSTRLRTVKKAAHKTRVLTQELSSRLAFLMNGLRQVQRKMKRWNSSPLDATPAHTCVLPVLSGRDCADIYKKGGRKSGVYFIRPQSAPTGFRALCDMDDAGGGWTIIQRRFDGSLDFDRSWREYKRGFGQWQCDSVGELWLGNEQIHLLTDADYQQLKVDLESWSNESRSALYKKFRITDEGDRYRLQEIDGYSTQLPDDIGNAFRGRPPTDQQPQRYTDHKGMRFTTHDEDNDLYLGNCASGGSGGWWFKRCSTVNLNAKWYSGGTYTREQTSTGDYDDGILWATWKGRWEALKKTTMKIRPSNFE